VTRVRLMTKNFRLTKRAKERIAGIGSHYGAETPGARVRAEIAEKAEVAGFKFL